MTGERVRLIRFRIEQRTSYGILRQHDVYPLPGDPYSGLHETGEVLDSAKVRMMAPVIPTKIVCVGLNYLDHAAELSLELPDEPVLFLKASTTVIGSGGTVIYPRQSGKVDYECELAVVMGKTARYVPDSQALSHVLGYTVGLDMTARDLQVKDGQWTRAKNFDTFCPLGPVIETELDHGDLALELRLNGEVRQSSRTSQMIFDVPRLISFITGIMTLFPGDVIMTGTPRGVGEVQPGDGIEAFVEGIGMLSCSVAAEGGQAPV